MKHPHIAALVILMSSCSSSARRAPPKDKYTVKVPGGLAFSEFKGYEGWETISVSHNPKVMAVIVGNPGMIAAYRAGIPANGKPVPDGAKMAKVHWSPKPNAFFKEATVPGNLVNVDFG